MSWQSDDGDATRAIDWPLTKDSVVFEIGGYKGRWALQIAKKYNPELYVFEPQRWAFEEIVKNLDGRNAKVFNFGLGERNATLDMGSYGNDGCSFLKSDGWDHPADIVDIQDFLRDYGIDYINLCLINIEGYEFTLIPYMIDTGIVNFIDYLMVQFHGFADSDHSQEQTIRERLAKTHDIYWDYGTVMCAWKKRGL